RPSRTPLRIPLIGVSTRARLSRRRPSLAPLMSTTRRLGLSNRNRLCSAGRLRSNTTRVWSGAGHRRTSLTVAACAAGPATSSTSPTSQAMPLSADIRAVPNPVQYCPAKGRLRRDHQFAPGAFASDLHQNIRRRKKPGAALWPLQDTQVLGAKIIPDTHIFQLFRIPQAVEVEMVHIPIGEAVGLHQGVGGALHRPLVSPAADNSPTQGGLARSQIPPQMDDTPGHGPPQALAKGHHGVVPFDIHAYSRQDL